MNAGKFVSDTSHQHNTSLHSYLHRSSPSSSTSTSSSPLQRQTKTTPVKDTLTVYSTNSTISVDNNDEQLLKSTCDQTKEVMGSTNKNSSWLLSNNRSIRKVDTSGSVKKLKRKSADIQSYFTSSGIVVTMYMCMYIVLHSQTTFSILLLVTLSYFCAIEYMNFGLIDDD